MVVVVVVGEEEDGGMVVGLCGGLWYGVYKIRICWKYRIIVYYFFLYCY